MHSDRVLVSLGLVALALVASAGRGQQPKTAQPGQPVNITVQSGSPSSEVSLIIGSRSGKVTPARSGRTHTGGGNIDVQQPAPDTVTITMAGVAVAYGSPTCSASASQIFELVQQLEVSFDKPSVKAAKLTVEGRLIGALRSHKLGSAEVCASATLFGENQKPGILLTMPAHSVTVNENATINDKELPPSIVVSAGKYTLTQSFKVSADMPKSLLPGKAPSAEFAPDPALDPLWISNHEPFRGAKKTDFGFQVTIKAVPRN